jgi:peptidase E
VYILNGSRSDGVGNILSVNFASGKYSQAETKFSRGTLPNQKMATVKSFIEDLEWAHTVIFNGGDTLNLLDVLDTFDLNVLKELLNQKVVIAYSAGISALTVCSANFDHMHYVQGTGILPYTSIVHYENYKQKAARALKEMYPNLPCLCIRDTDTIRFM